MQQHSLAGSWRQTVSSCSRSHNGRRRKRCQRSGRRGWHTVWRRLKTRRQMTSSSGCRSKPPRRPGAPPRRCCQSPAMMRGRPSPISGSPRRWRCSAAGRCCGLRPAAGGRLSDHGPDSRGCCKVLRRQRRCRWQTGRQVCWLPGRLLCSTHFRWFGQRRRRRRRRQQRRQRRQRRRR